MQYKSPTDLAELTLADRAQALLDSVLSDIEQMPPSSIQFRVSLMKPLMDALWRLTSSCATSAAASCASTG